MPGPGLGPVREAIERYLTSVEVDLSGLASIDGVAAFESFAQDFGELAAMFRRAAGELATLCRTAAGELRREQDVPDGGVV
jgi:hypothetical protein